MNKLPVVIIATNDYDDLWTRRQRFAVRFAARGHKVLYMNEYQHLFGIFSRPDDVQKRLNPTLSRVNNVFTGSLPYCLPFEDRMEGIHRWNAIRYRHYLDRYLRLTGIRECILINYSPAARLVIESLTPPPLFRVWDCVDDWEEFAGMARRKWIGTEMKKLFQTSDLSVTVSKRLMEKYSEVGGNRIIQIRNGFDKNLFNLQRKSHYAYKQVTYVGTIHTWLDFDIIEETVRIFKDFTFNFYGPVSFRAKKRFRKICKYCNVKHHGRINYLDVPRVMSESEFLWVPFRNDLLLESADLIKIYEYLASGRIILAPRYEQLTGLGSAAQVRLYSSMKELSRNLLMETRQEEKIGCEALDKFTWDHAFEKLYRGISDRMI